MRVINPHLEQSQRKYQERDKAKREEIKAAVTKALSEPDEEKIALQLQAISENEKARAAVAEPRWATRKRPVMDFNAQLFGEEPKQGDLFERYDANAEKRAEIDRRIAAARRIIEKEQAKATRSAALDSPAEECAALIAAWDPYDQNRSENFFDPNWMFDVKDGFDIVIGNPPYIQLQANHGELADLYESRGFETFTRTGDIYCLFYEKGVSFLAPSGHLCYITSNKWLRGGYGEKLRNYFLGKTRPVFLIDFAGEKIFEAASVDTSILLLANDPPSGEGVSCCMATEECRRDIAAFVKAEARRISFRPGAAWRIVSRREEPLVAKIEEVGTPLGKWNLQINRGILTGLNEAFVVDNDRRKQLIQQDPKSNEVLLPYIRGRDANRYYVADSGLWLVATHNGYGRIPSVSVSHYPAVRKWLNRFEPELSSRSDRGDTPYNLRNCAYWGDFTKPKMVWAETMRIRRTSNERFPRFTYVSGSLVTDKTCYFATGEKLKYLVGVMNSSVGWYLCRYYVSILDNGGYMMQKAFLEDIPVPSNPPAASVREIESLVDRILATKKGNPAADTSALEKMIDEIVYKLYGLTEEEIAIVEGRSAAARSENSPHPDTAGDVRRPKNDGRKTGGATKQPSVLDEDTDID